MIVSVSDVVHALVEDALAELSDEGYQRRVWLAVDGPEVSSFIECVSRLWDDSGLTDAIDRRRGAYGAVVDARLRSLRATLGRIDEGRAPAAILGDPSLAVARAEATGILSVLRSIGRPRAPEQVVVGTMPTGRGPEADGVGPRHQMQVTT